jgi:Mycotoxin biosynthesis protein UstYa
MHCPSPRTPSCSLTILSPLYDTLFHLFFSFSLAKIIHSRRTLLMYACMHVKTKAYVGSDHPRAWDIGYLPPIRMNIEPTKHYQLSGHNADAEWAPRAPHNGVIHLGPHRQPYSISLFHQLRCLDIIRRDIIVGSPPTPEDDNSKKRVNKLSRHCLNYMRQMVLCRADLALDPVLGRGLEARVRPDTNQCVDWRRVYEELEKNQQEYHMHDSGRRPTLQNKQTIRCDGHSSSFPRTVLYISSW